MKLTKRCPFHTANAVTLATISLYHHVIQKMLPTPTKMHYLFNLRDISKVRQQFIFNSPCTPWSCNFFLFYRSSKVCCEVAMNTNTPGARFFVCGYTRRIESSAIGSSTRSEHSEIFKRDTEILKQTTSKYSPQRQAMVHGWTQRTTWKELRNDLL